MLLVSRRAFLIIIAPIVTSQGPRRGHVDNMSAQAKTLHSATKTVLAINSRDIAVKYPDETNTGVVEKTLERSGPVTTSRDGQLIRGLDISGPVQINHSAVTLDNCRITATAFAIVNVVDDLSVAPIIQDCDLDGLGLNGAEGSNGINGYGTVRRCNIHGVENGINVTAPLLFEDNYVHDLAAPGSPHYDGVQIDGGYDIRILHNTIINGHAQTSAIMIDNYFNSISNITVDGNRLIGGGYTVYSDGRQGSGPISGVSFINNRIGRGRWGYTAFSGSKPVWRGNVDDITGRPI